MVILRDVALKAEVSIATVSLVLNGRGEELKLSAKAIARVRKAAQELGYRSNYHARTLRTGRSMTLGVVHGTERESFLAHRFWSAIAAGIDQEARRHGYNLLLLGAADAAHPLAETVDAMDRRRIDALLLLGGEVPAAIAKHAIPTVGIGAGAHRRMSRVVFDPVPGLRAGLEHLRALGHRRVLWIGATLDGKRQTPERLACVRAVAAELGLELREWSIAVAPYQREYERHVAVDREELSRLLPLPDGVTAVLCWNDTLALALTSLLIERGIRVPERCSVVGFDDLHADHVVPPLTSVGQGLAEQGAAAVTLALARLAREKPTAADMLAVVASRLVVRGSTGPRTPVGG